MAGTIKQTKIKTAIHYTHSRVCVERFLLSNLAEEDRLANPTAFADFQKKTGLADLYWQAVYYPVIGHKNGLQHALKEADGYLFFMHGWDGSHRIWEDLPLRLTAKHKKIVCFNLDVNGFGQSPFIQETPRPDQCSPAALMAAVEHWLSAINLWPATFRKRRPFYLFVGHSMSGAANFYKDVSNWQDETYGFYALAPALICNDIQRQAFFKAIGLGIRLPTLTALKAVLAPHMIHILGTGASPEVKNEHLRMYNETPPGTIAQTLYTMGGIVQPPPKRNDWARFRIALGHRDRVVGLENMLDLLGTLNIHSNQIRVTTGDHYFFSYGQGSPPSHKHNQQLILDDLLAFILRLTQESKGRPLLLPHVITETAVSSRL